MTVPVLAFDLVVGPVLVLLVFFALVGAAMARRRLRLDAAWAGIGELRERRHALVDELLAAAARLAPAEQAAVDAAALACARAAAAEGPVASGRAEGALSGALHALFAACEDYTNLHAAPGFVHVETELSQVETALARALRAYNREAAAFNRKVEMYPGTLVAQRYGFVRQPQCELVAVAPVIAAAPLPLADAA